MIGWFGIFSRKLYAAPRWIEPWDNIPQHAAEVIHNGGIVIGNNPSFFFYMTYTLPDSDAVASHSFAGLLPKIRRAGVYDPTQWLDVGRPLGPTTLLIKGLHFDIPAEPTEATEDGWTSIALSRIPSNWSTTPSKVEAALRTADGSARMANRDQVILMSLIGSELDEPDSNLFTPQPEVTALRASPPS